MRSGVVVHALADRYGLEVTKLWELHVDVLIGLGARRVGAHLITCNSRDSGRSARSLPSNSSAGDTEHLDVHACREEEQGTAAS